MEESIVGNYDEYDEEIIHLYSLDKETKPCNDNSCEYIYKFLNTTINDITRAERILIRADSESEWERLKKLF